MEPIWDDLGITNRREPDAECGCPLLLLLPKVVGAATTVSSVEADGESADIWVHSQPMTMVLDRELHHDAVESDNGAG